MRKSYVTLAVGLIIILMNSCYNGKKTSSAEVDSDTLCTCPPESFVHIDLQPLGDFTQKEANQLKEELEKHLVPIYLSEIEVLPKKDIPESCLYKPRNRYWAGKILGFLKQQNQESDFVTIGLTHRDISTSIHGQYNYGIMGLSFRPGDACVVSTFRLKRKDDLWKVTTHEFLHSRGLPHCKKDDLKCLMQDAHGKNTFYMKHGLCEDCKKSLRMIMTHQETKCQNT